MKDTFVKSYELGKQQESVKDIYVFEGIATEYGIIDKTGELILNGAFEDDIGKTIPVQIMHQGISTVIGSADIEQQGNKIVVKGRLYKEIPQAVAIAISKSEGVQYNLSIGGYRKEWEYQNVGNEEVLVMKKGKINEISFTGEDQQAHQSAKVTKTIKQTEVDENMAMTKEDIAELAKALGSNMDKAENGEKSKAEMKKMQGQVEGLLEEIKKSDEKNESLENLMEGMKKTIETMDNTINEITGAAGSINKTDDMKESEAFNKYLREDNPSKELKKAINTTGAGNLIPQLLANEIIKDLKESSPFFADAKHYMGTRDSIDIPVRDSWTNAVEVVAEGSAVVTKGSLTYSLLNIKAIKIQSEIQLTDEMREDTDFDMQAEIREANVEDFAVTLSSSIEGGVYATSGFEGITVNSALVAAAQETETASTITADDLIDMEFSINTNYRMGAKYYMSRAAMKLAKKFKDENGQYLWQSPITLGTPPVFNGYPVVECPDMDDLTDGNFPVLFANMQKLYALYIRKGMETEMDRYASEGMWNHITRMRVGGRVRNVNAGVLLEIKATA